jgi:hypothetical protein
VHAGASYFDQDWLVDWLREVLDQQIGELCGEDGGASVTFEELHRLTCIELYVVAVDLNRRRLVVFHRKLTPKVPIAGLMLRGIADGVGADDVMERLTHERIRAFAAADPMVYLVAHDPAP